MDGVDAGERVHVRRLDVVDTLRWSWHALADRPELVGLTVAVQLVGTAAALGIEPGSATEDPAVAAWVWPVYPAYLLALAATWGVHYLAAADAVAERSRPLADYAAAAAKRLPALVGLALLMWALVGVGLALLVLPGIYLFHRLVLSYPACVIDGKGPVAALKASWRVTRGSVWKIVGVSVAYYLLAVASGVGADLVGEAAGPVGGVVSVVGGSVLVALFGLALGHLYLEGSRNA